MWIVTERGPTTVFIILILTGLLPLTAVGIEIGRIVYARGGPARCAPLSGDRRDA